MPNSTDKPSEEEQQKDSGQAVGGADAHEPSEQSLRKRDRQSTPHCKCYSHIPYGVFCYPSQLNCCLKLLCITYLADE